MRWIAGASFKLILLVALILAGRELGDAMINRFSKYLTPSTEPAMHRLIMASMLVYVVLMALPFVPGAEIGFALMVMFGARVVPLVYGATVMAMLLAFLIGRLVPQDTAIRLLSALRLARSAQLFAELRPLTPLQRLEHVLNIIPNRIGRFLLNYRFLALAVLLNVPGNVLIGGGGGLCMFAGFSRLFGVFGFVMTVALAILPVPLFFFLSG